MIEKREKKFEIEVFIYFVEGNNVIRLNVFVVGFGG